MCRSRARLGQRPEAKAAVVLVRSLDHAQALAEAACARRSGARFRERVLQEASHRLESLRGYVQRAAPALVANSTARLSGEADERPLLATGCATGQMRQVAGKPEQLELE